ncbi:hypothetical protein PTKU15_84500 [Paraburkholderia terrae]|nr:hypothetical protein PTKU15_84500 [Paraburkholderia terrae]
MHNVTAMFIGRRLPANCLPVATIQRERYAARRAIVAPELEAIGAPAGVVALYRNATVLAPLISMHAGAAQQQLALTHHPIHPVGVDARCAGLFSTAALRRCSAQMRR